MNRSLLWVVVAGVLGSTGACSLNGGGDTEDRDPPVRNDRPPEGDTDKADPAPKAPKDRTAERARAKGGTHEGVLKSGFAGVGGESTGWVLDRDGTRPDLEVDVSKVPGKAKRLDGKRVVATGKVVDKKYVERGTVRVLMVEDLQEAKVERY